MKFKKFGVYGSITIIIFVFFILAVVVYKDNFLSFTYTGKVFGWFNKENHGINDLNNKDINDLNNEDINYLDNKDINDLDNMDINDLNNGDINDLNNEFKNIDYPLPKCVDTSSFRKNTYFKDVTNDKNNIFVDSQDITTVGIREYRIYEYNYSYSWLNKAIFYRAIANSENYIFRNTNLTEQEIVKIKNYLKKSRVETNVNLENYESEQDEESKNLINKIYLDKAVENILATRKFFGIEPKKYIYNITSIGTFSKIERTFKSDIAKKIIKMINEIKIIPQNDGKKYIDSTISKKLDPYTNQNFNEIIHLDFTGVFLSKDEIDRLKIVLEDDLYSEEKKFFYKFKFTPKEIFFKKLYDYLKRSGLEIPDFMIDNYTKIIIKNPAQFDMNSDKFYEYSIVYDCLRYRKNHPITNKAINNDICWAKKEGEPTNEKCMNFINKQNEFINKTGPRFSALFHFIREMKIFV